MLWCCCCRCCTEGVKGWSWCLCSRGRGTKGIEGRSRRLGRGRGTEEIRSLTQQVVDWCRCRCRCRSGCRCSSRLHLDVQFLLLASTAFLGFTGPWAITATVSAVIIIGISVG